jgi:RNA polymerase sigma factor (sigma-70 family)
MEERRLGKAAVRVARGVDERTDEELLRAMRDGDDSAFGEVWIRHEPDARRYARTLTGRTDVDDVVAEAFTKVLNAIRQGRGPTEHPIRYVMVAIRTSVFNAHNARARDHAVLRSVRDLGSHHRYLPELDDRLAKAVKALPAQWRTILWWTEVDGMSAGEVSERLQIAPAAASSLAYRARKALRAAYASTAPDHPDQLAG